MDEHSSESLSVKCSVPLGSTLGYLLFICYVNDVTNYINTSCVYLYADDTVCYAASNDIPYLNDLLNQASNSFQ